MITTCDSILCRFEFLTVQLILFFVYQAWRVVYLGVDPELFQRRGWWNKGRVEMKIMKTFLFIHVIKVYNHKSQSNILLYNYTSSYSFFSSGFNLFHYIFVYFKNSMGGWLQLSWWRHQILWWDVRLRAAIVVWSLVLHSIRGHFAHMEGHCRKPRANCKIRSLVVLRQV